MNEKKILGLVDKMIANKIIVNGKIYYAAIDVMAITDAMQTMTSDYIKAYNSILN